MAEEHYLGNPLLKKAYVPQDLTEEQVFELTRCSLDPVYFAKNYVKIVTLDHGLQPFELFPFQERMISSFNNNRFNILLTPRQVGKPLSLNTPIPTPTGWTTMGDIKVGDQVLSPSGAIVNVVFKTDTMYDHDCYEMTFDTGEKIVSDADHLWEVGSSYWNHKKKSLTTKEISEIYAKKKKNPRGKGVQGSLYTEVTKPFDFPKKDLKIDPYILGLWLGDGYAQISRIVAHKDDYEFYKTKLEIEAERPINNCMIFKVKDMQPCLKEYNLLKNKHIPQDYLRSSYEDRLELLRGLMDSDGSLKKNSRTFEFYQKDYNFILQFVELLSTMGIKSKTRSKLINGVEYYTVIFTTSEIVFNLPRKIAGINNTKQTHPKTDRHYIHSIEKVDSVPVACIKVDTEDHLFLCGKSFIPTHNTTTVVSFLLHYAMFNENVNVAVLANKAATARDILNKLQIGYENLPKWLQLGICSWNKGSMELENGSKIIAASTSASSVRGSTYNILFLDEFAFVPQQVADSFMASVYPTITSGKDTKVIIVSCVTKDTYLLTDKGYRKIETLIDSSKSGAYIVPDYTVMGKSQFYSSNIVVNQGRVPTNIIKTRYETIECSETHKLWAYKDGKYEYVKSENLSVGDYVAISYNQQFFADDDYVGYFPEKGKSHNLFSCEYVTPDIAYFIGLYVSEGYARKVYTESGELRGGQIVITCGDDISDSLSKLDIKFTTSDDFHYIINSKQLVQFIETLGFDVNKKAKEKILPDKVLSWSKKNITALLRGMFDGDGCIDTKGRVSYVSTSRELIRQVQLLLANLGLLGSIYTNITKPTKKVKVSSTVHSIELTGEYACKYFDEIGFGLPRKSNRKEFLKSSSRLGGNTDIIPNSYNIIKQEAGITGRGKKFDNYSRKFLLENKDKFYEDANDILKDFFDDNVSPNIIWLKIKEITKSENEVFDVSLPDVENDKWCHSVLYNNFLGHQTPNGMNQFYKLWDDAIKQKNKYIPTRVYWQDVPGRDEKFKEETIANMGQTRWDAEFECNFLGSSDTLISGAKLSNLVIETPIRTQELLDVFEEPVPGRVYVITVDVAEGVELDYSAFVVFDATQIPYKVVAKYKNNDIPALRFPDIIEPVGRAYNNAYILCEINNDAHVANILHNEYGYPNVIQTKTLGRGGQVAGQNFSGKGVKYGIKMSKPVKRCGCMNLKTFIEEDKLIVHDIDIIDEMTTFVQRYNSFSAEEGKNDDLIMCLVLFSWLVTQEYFKEMTETDIRKQIREEHENKLEENDGTPFGFISTVDDHSEPDIDGNLWIAAEPEPDYSFFWTYNY